MHEICLASPADKNKILALYKTMLYGPADWNENYPNEETIEFDMSRDALFVMKNDDDEVIAAISIDKDNEVDSLPYWDKSLAPSGEFSRICVRKDMQNKGIARQMILHVFDVMRKDGKKGAHILVKTGHEAALALYGKLGFKTVGECFMYGKDFICMEVKL